MISFLFFKWMVKVVEEIMTNLHYYILSAGIQASADNLLNHSQTLRRHFSASSINLEYDEDLQCMLGLLCPR
ncbi:Hypothetical predicted protein [Podarcis lilfordi]|uniref:Uncharacterized protein n=1 Tax=Podarcis lilfordi TaxID=74358 RepID=A0AA35NYV3_9SAUR|nr:Hypothetical predicted protein [Podarcis lilfordi]